MRSNNRKKYVSVIGMIVLVLTLLAPVAASADTPIKCVANCKNGTTIVSGDTSSSSDASASQQEDDSTPSNGGSDIEPYDGSQPQDNDLPVSCVQGVGCESGNHHGGNNDGVVLTNRFYAQGMTGVGERVAWDVTVPDGYDLVVEGVIVRIDGTMLNDEGSVVWIADGDRHIDITDGAWGVVREELAKDEACTRYISNLRRNNAMTALFTPEGQETDCGVDVDSTSSGNGSSSNDDTDGGEAAVDHDAEGNPICRSGETYDSGDGWMLTGVTGTCSFAAGTEVVGQTIVAGGNTYNDCVYKGESGQVTNGAINPGEGDKLNKSAC